MKLLSSGDVAEIIAPYGITQRLLDRWITGVPLIPHEGGEGTGHHRKWTQAQALGIAVAAQVFNSERGCVLGYVGSIVQAFEKLEDLDLLKAFQNGGTHLLRVITTVNGGPHVVFDGPGEGHERVNIEETWRQMLAKIAEMESRLKRRPGTGRLRGLALEREEVKAEG